MKKIISAVISMAVAVSVMTTNVISFAETGLAEQSVTGQCGDNLKWSLNQETGVLTISGEGEMYDSKDKCAAWDYYTYKNDIKEVVFEEGVVSIGKCAFGQEALSAAEFPNLTKVSFPSTLEKIGYYAFEYLNITSIDFPEGLKQIGFDAFRGTSLTSVKLHEGLEMIGGTFNDCNSLKEVTIPKDLKYLTVGYSMGAAGNYAFAGCKALEKVIIEGGGSAYQRYGDPIPNALPESLFNNCSSLNTVIIKGNLEHISSNTFGGCTSLTDIYFYSTELNAITRAYIGTTINNLISIDLSNNPTFHIVKGSKTETTLNEYGYLSDENTVYLAKTEELEEAISKAEEIDITKYTEETASVLTEALKNAKAVLENTEATQDEADNAAEALNNAITGLKEKPAPTGSEPSGSSANNPNKPSTVPNKTTGLTKATRSAQAVAKDKKAAVKAMKQAKLTSLKVKSKAKKKINVSWKKVKKAKGYEVQVSAKKNFKKVIFKKDLKKTKLNIKNKKIKSKKTYFVRVRAYAEYKDANNKAVKVYSSWNKKLRKVKVK